jgi:hypothetical protein
VVDETVTVTAMLWPRATEVGAVLALVVQPPDEAGVACAGPLDKASRLAIMATAAASRNVTGHLRRNLVRDWDVACVISWRLLGSSWIRNNRNAIDILAGHPKG